jgi:hypothetical protein
VALLLNKSATFRINRLQIQSYFALWSGKSNFWFVVTFFYWPLMINNWKHSSVNRNCYLFICSSVFQIIINRWSEFNKESYYTAWEFFFFLKANAFFNEWNIFFIFLLSIIFLVSGNSLKVTKYYRTYRNIPML